MKRILLAAMASIALLISSCGKSDDSSGDITGIWQLESETVNGQSQTINDCEKKTVVVFTQNQMTSHDFIENAGACRYSKHVEAYKIEGNVIKSNDDSSISFPFSVSGNTLTIESVDGQEKTIFKYKKITQAELDAILATANNNNGGGNNNGGRNNNAQNLEGIWQIESETVNGQSQRINDCEKKTVAVFTQNQITTHDFIENAGVCRYSKSTKSYRIEGNVIKSDTDPDESLSFSVSGNTFTIEFVENAKIFVFKYRKITQAELDAILATVNNGGN
ncbi:lipocalin family protein [Capnocytophaga gingivalis]|uniref:lipocalin family protein n=1 Tax=Capnocytophaga gingivalis TaxID=1017 RepID=UPI00288AACA5|nr:lipocalin family protein [Capnocytophaga gingivalis]